MHAVVLCPGPSLGRATFGRHRGGPVVAVNRAARLGCDWWAAGDPWPVRREAGWVRGRPSLFTTLAAARELSATDPAVLWRFGRGRVLRFDHLYDWLPPGPARWPAFTATAALVLCGWLGATRVSVYGADRAVGAADWDGRQDPDALRDADRWAAEAEAWAQTVAALGRRGVSVERVGAGTCAGGSRWRQAT